MAICTQLLWGWKKDLWFNDNLYAVGAKVGENSSGIGCWKIIKR